MKLLITFCLAIVTGNQSDGWKKVERKGMVFEWMIEGVHLRCIMSAPTLGWVAIGFNTHSGLTGTNLIMGAVEQEFYRIDDRYIVAPGNHKSMIQMGAEDQITLKSGREWQGKFFTNLNAWKLEADNGGNAAPAPPQNFNKEATSVAPAANVNNNVDAREDLDDLPF